MPSAANAKAPDWQAELRHGAYRLSPFLWVERELKPKLGTDLDPWQRKLISANRGSRTCCLTFRQAGKSTAASIAISHDMVFMPGSVSLALAPTQRQSAEIGRKVRIALIAAGQKLKVDNTFELQLDNGSRMLSLPGSSDESIRGLSVDGTLAIDEAARVSDELYHAARPMLARHADKARLIVMSTAWLSSGFFYEIWERGDETDWMKIRVMPSDTGRISEKFLGEERRALGERAFDREYGCVFDSDDANVFTWGQIDAAFGKVECPTPPLKPPFGQTKM